MIALQDRRFLRHDLHLLGITESVSEITPLIVLICSITNRLREWPYTFAVRKSRGVAEDPLSGESICDKLTATCQHLLRSLQSIALDAIITHRYLYLDQAETHNLHWQFRWQHSKRLGEEWFAEWPNSHRPLSTTWPWNIKPSLVVLWGVCWMFYGPSGNDKKKTTRNQRGAAPSDEDLRTGPLGSRSQPSQQST